MHAQIDGSLFILVLGCVAVSGLFGCSPKIEMKPGTGALRVRSYVRKGTGAKVYLHKEGAAQSADLIDGVATFTDLAPAFWGVTVVTADGRAVSILPSAATRRG